MNLENRSPELGVYTLELGVVLVLALPFTCTLHAHTALFQIREYYLVLITSTIHKWSWFPRLFEFCTRAKPYGFICVLAT